MRRYWLPLIGILLVAAGCDDMHRQPSLQPQEAPRLSAPETTVPVSGKERLAFGQPLENPVADSGDSRQQGRELYAINCLLCHGTRMHWPGKVGSRLEPPPPKLHDGHLGDFAPATLYQLISLGFGRMPPFRQRLAPQERWHLVNYLRAGD